MNQKITLSAILILAFTAFINPEINAQGNGGYAPAILVSDTDGFSYANQYKAKNGTSLSGGVITREALNAILNNSNCNAITYKLCMDTTGRVAPADAVFIILSGANVTEKNGQTTVTDIGAKKYSPNNWCPPSCMKFMIRNAEGELVPVE